VRRWLILRADVVFVVSVFFILWTTRQYFCFSVSTGGRDVGACIESKHDKISARHTALLVVAFRDTSCVVFCVFRQRESAHQYPSRSTSVVWMAHQRSAHLPQGDQNQTTNTVTRSLTDIKTYCPIIVPTKRQIDTILPLAGHGYRQKSPTWTLGIQRGSLFASCSSISISSSPPL